MPRVGTKVRFQGEKRSLGEGTQKVISVGGKRQKVLGFAVQYGREQGKVHQVRCGANRGQKLQMLCGQRTQIFCPRHLLIQHRLTWRFL